jgi:N-carbamoylputrescine amidase
MDDATRTPTARTLRVAAVQMPSRLADTAGNLARATGHGERAVAEGAELLLFPELMPGGYAWDERAWAGAEPSDGPTARWLRETAARLGVWLGTSFLEAAGEDFWNTFVLAGPDGNEAGRVRKAFPSMFEARVFRGDPGTHAIDTPFGRVGVGICFDAHTVAVARQFVDADVDLVLAPHCYCVPRAPSRGVSQADIDRLVGNLAEVPRIYAGALGVPAVATNRVGDWDVAGREGYAFPGKAAIVDGGAVRAQLGAGEGIAVADVTLDAAAKTHRAPAAHGRYIYPGPPGREILRLIEWREGRRYRRNPGRAAAVRDVELAVPVG